MAHVWVGESPGRHVPGTPNLRRFSSFDSPPAVVPQVYTSTGSTPSPFWPTPSSLSSSVPQTPHTPQNPVAPPVFSMIPARRTSSATSDPRTSRAATGRHQNEQVVPGTPQSNCSPSPAVSRGSRGSCSDSVNNNNNNSNNSRSDNINNNNSGPSSGRLEGRPRRGSSVTDQVFCDALLRHAQTSGMRLRRVHSDDSSSNHRTLTIQNSRHRSTPTAHPPHRLHTSQSSPSVPGRNTASVPAASLAQQVFRGDLFSVGSSASSRGSSPRREIIQRVRHSPDARLVPDLEAPCLELFSGNDIFL